MPVVIQVQNESTAMTDSAATRILIAVAAQVKQDVAPAWGFGAVALQFFSKGEELDPDQRQFIILDASDHASAAGYHQTTSGGAPIGYAFVRPTIAAGLNPSVTISHEILEMLGDERVDQYCIWSDLPNPLFLCRELCDPVEADDFAYETAGFPGVKVSNFVLPSYFLPDAKGPFDFRRVLKGANTLAPGGYQSTWAPRHGHRAVEDDRCPSKRLALGRTHREPLSRTERRRVGRREWLRSEERAKRFTLERAYS